jgi:hypothetical protein
VSLSPSPGLYWLRRCFWGCRCSGIRPWTGGSGLLRLTTDHVNCAVIPDAFRYAPGFCRARRAKSSSFPILRTPHFDKRSTISLARTCLHRKQPGMFSHCAKMVEVQWMGYIASTESAISAQRAQWLGRCSVWNRAGAM